MMMVEGRIPCPLEGVSLVASAACRFETEGLLRLEPHRLVASRRSGTQAYRSRHRREMEDARQFRGDALPVSDSLEHVRVAKLDDISRTALLRSVFTIVEDPKTNARPASAEYVPGTVTVRLHDLEVTSVERHSGSSIQILAIAPELAALRGG